MIRTTLDDGRGCGKGIRILRSCFRVRIIVLVQVRRRDQ
jgi:hypothetical protein